MVRCTRAHDFALVRVMYQCFYFSYVCKTDVKLWFSPEVIFDPGVLVQKCRPRCPDGLLTSNKENFLIELESFF